MWHRSCHIFNASSVVENQWSEQWCKQMIVYKAIVSHNSETTDSIQGYPKS